MASTNQAGARDLAAAQAGPAGDPLGSWREGASKQAIQEFVQRGHDRRLPRLRAPARAGGGVRQ
jgi:hypothetical protein